LLPWCFRGSGASGASRGVLFMAKFSKRIVDQVKAGEKDYFIWDEELSGFGLRVFKSGKRN
jgi:hypothetical protein